MVRLYYTGADSFNSPQQSANKSSGGFFSSSPVPNGLVGAVFSDISNLSIQNKSFEVKGFGLKNESGAELKDVILYYISPEDNFLSVQVAAIVPNKNEVDGGECEYYIEKVPNIRSLPVFSQEFHTASAQFASAQLQLETPAISGEVITVLGVNTSAASSNLTLDETYELIESSFVNNADYEVSFVIEEVVTVNNDTGEETVTENKYLLIKRKSIGVNTDTVTFSTTGSATIKESVSFSGGFDNSINIGNIKPGEYIGLWFKTELNLKNIQNQECVQSDKLDDLVKEENIELIFEY